MGIVLVRWDINTTMHININEKYFKRKIQIMFESHYNIMYLKYKQMFSAFKNVPFFNEGIDLWKKGYQFYWNYFCSYSNYPNDDTQNYS